MRFKRLLPILLILAGAVIVTKPALAQTPTDERLAAYEKIIQDLQKQIDQLKKDVSELKAARDQAKPTAPLTKPVATSQIRPVTLFGVTQSQFEDTTAHGTSRFLMRRVRIGVRGAMDKNFNFESEGEFAGTAVSLRTAYIDFSGLRGGPATPNLRFGQYKPPYSLEAIEYDAQAPLIERSLASDQLAVSHDRDTGIGVLSKENPERPYAYSLAIMNGAGRNQSAATRDKMFAGRVQINTPKSKPVLGGDILLGFSSRQGHTINLNQPAGSQIEDERYSVDAQYLAKGLRMRGEYLWGRNGSLKPEGFYGLIGFHTSRLTELLARYEGYSPDPNSLGAHRVTLGMSYQMSTNTRAMFNYELLSGTMPGQTSGVRFRLQTQFP